LMAAVGVLGTLGSPLRTRSAFFLIWSAGTLIGVPLLMMFLRSWLGEWPARSLALYASAQSLLILGDAVVCMPTAGKYHLGRVMIYGNELCRPHALYQEPGYFCAFAL